VFPDLSGQVQNEGTDRSSSQFENNYFTEMCSGSEAGSYLRLVDLVYHSTIGLRVIKKRRRNLNPSKVLLSARILVDYPPPTTYGVTSGPPKVDHSHSEGRATFQTSSRAGPSCFFFFITLKPRVE